MENPQKSHRLWGGRFSENHVTHAALEDINRSIDVDRRLFRQDIQGSMAYASALRSVGLLSDEEMVAIHDGLRKVLSEWETGTFVVVPGDEDIHTANERRLSELIGSTVGGKLHTGRSRNDQVSTDTRLWLRDAATDLSALIVLIIEAMVLKAEQEAHVLMPGYTHLQRAQPVRWSHWLLSHAWALRADRNRLDAVVSRAMSEMPLGSGALAGTPLALDRMQLARELGFTGVSHNSMHAVADRDFAAEFVFWAALTGTHMSRLAEDLILFCTAEFGFVRLDEALTTGSSLMPHKRNPDGLELVRAKSATISGQCSTLLSLLKGLPLTYNKDLQEDKAAMFSAHDDLRLALRISLATIQGLKVHHDACRSALSIDTLATDLAYYLVHKGIPFREAHRVVGEVVRIAEERRCQIHQLSLEDLRKISDVFEGDVSRVWDFHVSVEQYECQGGTSENSVAQQISLLMTFLSDWRTKCK